MQWRHAPVMRMSAGFLVLVRGIPKFTADGAISPKLEEAVMTETIRSEIEIAAPPATVFAFLTDPEKIVRWMGSTATMEPHPGGIYLVNANDKYIARGQFTEVIPVHRLAYSFGWEGRDDMPPGSSLVEIDLEEMDGGTLVRFTHSGLPSAEERARHETGWAHYLRRLAVAAAGGDPGPDTPLQA
jgi:uncharacterized protein YndB with AHSA1/START domain